MTELKINFGKYIHCLWMSCSRNFYHEQLGRFVHLEGSDINDSKYMYFFDRYLEAKIFQSLAEREDYKTGLYSDERDGDYFVVITDFKGSKLL